MEARRGGHVIEGTGGRGIRPPGRHRGPPGESARLAQIQPVDVAVAELETQSRVEAVGDLAGTGRLELDDAGPSPSGDVYACPDEGLAHATATRGLVHDHVLD